MRNVTVNSIGEYIREQREQARISMRQLAQAAGVSNPYLSQIERGLRKPSADILQQIAKGLRISAEALYVQAGILEDRPADSGVRSAVLTDPELSERQKQVLIEIYESFRRENAAAAEAAQAPAAEAAQAPAGEAAQASGADGAEASGTDHAEASGAADAQASDVAGDSRQDGSSGPEGNSGHADDDPGRADDISGHADDMSDQTMPPIR
jgi:transcriptional regulator with XRE-family HTH domain